MGAQPLSSQLLGIDEAELAPLGRFGARLLLGQPSVPYGSSPRRVRPGSGLEFLDHAAYASGDDPRRIDWRATARAREPVVRRYRDEALFRVYLALDRSASMNAQGGAGFALARRVALVWAHLLTRAGNRVGLLAFSDRVERCVTPAGGARGFCAVLSALRSLEPRRDGGASRLESCAPYAGPGSSVIVVSDFLAPGGFARALDSLLFRRALVQAICIGSADDVTPRSDLAGERVLRDAETGEVRRLRLDARSRSEARRRFAAQRLELRHHCRSRGVPLTECPSGQPWRELLIAHLRSLDRLRA